MAAFTTAVEGPSSILLDYVQMYQLVVDFKDTLSKVFLEKGLLTESSKLTEFKTFPVETHVDESPQVQQLSANVFLVFKLIAELLHTVVANNGKVQPGAVTTDKASQTEKELLTDVVVNDASSPIKSEKEEDGDSAILSESTPPHTAAAPKLSTAAPKPAKSASKSDTDTPLSKTSTKAASSHPACVPLRKSSRSSVLNRKPFVTPRKQSAKKVKPSTKPAGGGKKGKQHCVGRKNSTSPRTTSPRAKSPKANSPRTKRAASPQPVVKTEVKLEAPKRKRRSIVVTNMYERTAEGKFRCKECGKEAKLQTNIRKHLRKHTGEKPYRCSKCPVAFAYPRSLKRHELVHEGIRPYNCSECNKSFFDPTSLRTHSRVHTDDRPYVCQICGNRFRQNEGLKGHMRRHTGDRPYVCERCGMAFAAKRSLTRHIRVHTGERPYRCDQCVAAFADWTTLHNHKLVHRTPVAGDNGGEGQDGGEGGGDGDCMSENKPYQCQFCGVRYRQPLSLKRHLRLHSSSSNNNANSQKPSSSPKKPRKRRAEDGQGFDGEESKALHLQYRPYACKICGERFKHLRGYETHKNKHERGALVGKKVQCKRAPKGGDSAAATAAAVASVVGELNNQDIEQAASILASVAVNSTSLPDANSKLPLSIIHLSPPPPPLPSNSTAATTTNTITVIDAATFSSLTNAESVNIHIPVSTASIVGHGMDMIQYAPGNVTQVIQYPDGTLSEVTTLVPHTPSPIHHQAL